MVKAAPMNLYCLVNLSSAASELRFTSSASESGQTNQNIIGDLLNERLILTSLATAAQASQNSLTESQLFVEFNSRLPPIYHDNDRSVSGSPLVTQNSLLQSQQNYLPCAELAFALLQDRSFRGTTSASTAVNAIVASLTQQRDHLQGKTSTEHTKTDITVFQCYLHGLMGLLCALQMLSANRPFLSNASSTTARRASSFAEASKAHHLTIRQIRLAFVRWTKSLLPMFINAASQSCSLPSTKCIEIIKPVNLIRRVFILDSVAVLNESQSENSYQLTSSLYPVQDVWPDQDQNEMSELAYANIYWKVTLTCMILAAYCPRTCGKSS
ncbi:unnamed protein product [Trichobilharzia regenti]|nr:unnamed protein product [Trichobilharzia regenti]